LDTNIKAPLYLSKHFSGDYLEIEFDHWDSPAKFRFIKYYMHRKDTLKTVIDKMLADYARIIDFSDADLVILHESNPYGDVIIREQGAHYILKTPDDLKKEGVLQHDSKEIYLYF